MKATVRLCGLLDIRIKQRYLFQAAKIDNCHGRVSNTMSTHI